MGRLILLYERGRKDGGGPDVILGLSFDTDGGSVGEECSGDAGRSNGWNTAGGVGGDGGNDVAGSGEIGGWVADGLDLDHVSGTLESLDTLLLWRRSSSTCSVLMGDGERQDLLLDLFACCSKRAIASVTGTLLEVVWFKSSRRRAI